MRRNMAGRLQAVEASSYDEARKTIAAAVKAPEPGTMHSILTSRDIDTGRRRANDAINRPKNARDLRVNPVLQLNLANAASGGGQRQRRETIRARYATQP